MPEERNDGALMSHRLYVIYCSSDRLTQKRVCNVNTNTSRQEEAKKLACRHRLFKSNFQASFQSMGIRTVSFQQGRHCSCVGNGRSSVASSKETAEVINRLVQQQETQHFNAAHLLFKTSHLRPEEKKPRKKTFEISRDLMRTKPEDL